MRSTVTLLALALVAVLPATAHAAIGVVSMRPLALTEGERIASSERVAVFSDTGQCETGAYVVAVNWGDGTSSAGRIVNPQEITGIGGQPDSCNYAVAADHAYRAAGAFPLSATVCRGADCQAGAGGIASVTEAAVKGEAQAFAAVAGQAYAGPVAEFNDDNRLAQPGDYTAVVDWGDGTSTAGVVTGRDGRFDVAGTHAYAAPGSYLLRVTLAQGGVARAVADPVTVVVAGAASAAALPTRINASSVNPAVTNRNALTIRARTVRRSALARGVVVRLSVPSATRTVRFTVARVGAGARTVGTQSVRVRGGTVANGQRSVELRVRFAKRLRAKLKPGSYVLRFRIGSGPQVTAGFRVTR